MVDSLRADLEASMADVEAPVTEPEQTITPPNPDTPEDFAPSNESSPGEAAPIPAQAEPQEPAEPAQASKKREKALSAPIDWTPEDKLAFATLPENVQRAIHQREVAINQTMQQTAEARKFNERLVHTIEPYRALMLAEGTNDPIAAVDGLLRTAATLSMGSQAQKAQRIAQLIQHYGIDIETLDKTLAGSQPQNTEEDRLNQMLEQRLQPVNQLMQQLGMVQQQQYQQVQQTAVQTVEEMAQDANYPYFDAVRGVMADFMDLAQTHGQALSLHDAYHRACAAIPEISQQVMMQQSNGVAQMQQNHIRQKSNAASSIVGRVSNGTGGKPNYDSMSIRDILATQMSGGDQRV